MTQIDSSQAAIDAAAAAVVAAYGQEQEARRRHDATIQAANAEYEAKQEEDPDYQPDSDELDGNCTDDNHDCESPAWHAENEANWAAAAASAQLRAALKRLGALLVACNPDAPAAWVQAAIQAMEEADRDAAQWGNAV